MVTLIGHSVPTDKVHHIENDTSANVEGNDVGHGTLFITESFVMWLNHNNEGFQLEYRDISLHAVSRDLTSFPHEHLLLHYGAKLAGTTANNDTEEEDEDGMQCNQEEESLMTEIRFVPQNKDSLDAMFSSMSDCQVLHPDPDDDCVSDEDFEDAEEEGDRGDGFFTGEEGLSHLSEAGRANFERLNNMLQVGQGDSDIATRTGQISITNGHHDPEKEESSDQFQDADGMNE